MNYKINVGIIGGSLNNQWASQTHIPVLKDHPHYQIQAIGTSKLESAEESAKKIKAPLAFVNHQELARAKSVDLVVVSVKVPHHYEATCAAIAENKHVYCEWPLGVNTQQAEELAKLADQANIHHAIGLQARQSPEVKYLKTKIEKGEIGKILSCNMHVYTPGKGGLTNQNGTYLLQKENGASLLAINGGHSLDMLSYLLGDFVELSAITHNHYPEAVIRETGVKTPKNTADQIIIQGVLEKDISASVHIQGGVYPKFELNIYGEKGVFRLIQDQSVGHVQFGNLRIERITHPNFNSITNENVEIRTDDITVSLEYDKNPKGNIKRAYDCFAQDIFENKWKVPNFNDAVKLHKLLDVINKSAKQKRRVSVSEL